MCPSRARVLSLSVSLSWRVFLFGSVAPCAFCCLGRSTHSTVYCSFRDEFKESVAKFKATMLTLYSEKTKELNNFNLNYYGNIEKVDQQSKAMIAAFKTLKKMVLSRRFDAVCSVPIAWCGVI